MDYKNSNIFLAKTKRIAQALSNKTKVPVILINSTSNTDGVNLYLDVKYGYYEGELKKFYDGVIDHEVAHLLFSQFVNVNAKKVLTNQKAIKYLSHKGINYVNQHLEDLRVNELMSNKYIGSRENIQFMERTISIHYEEKLNNGLLPFDEMTRFLLGLRFSLYPDIFKMLFGKDKQTIDNIGKVWNKKFLKIFENCDETEKTIFLSKLIYDYFNKKKNIDESEEESEDDDDDEEEEEESEEEESEEEESGEEESEEDESEEEESEDDDDDDESEEEEEEEEEESEEEEEEESEEEEECEEEESEEDESDSFIQDDNFTENIENYLNGQKNNQQQELKDEIFDDLIDVKDVEIDLTNFNDIRRKIDNIKYNNLFDFGLKQKLQYILDRGNIIVEENINEVSKLSKMFEQLLYSKSLNYEYETEKDGEMNLIEFVKEDNFDYNARFKYLKNFKTNSKSLAVSILVDISGSMSGHIKYVRNMLWNLSKSLTRANVVLEVTAHNANQIQNPQFGKDSINYNYILKSFNCNSIDKIKYITTLCDGINCDGYAMQYALNRLHKRNEDRKVFFYICDGYPTGYVSTEAGKKHMKYMVEIMKHINVEFYGIGLAVQVVNIFGKEKSFEVDKTKSLAVDLTKILLKKM